MYSPRGFSIALYYFNPSLDVYETLSDIIPFSLKIENAQQDHALHQYYPIVAYTADQVQYIWHGDERSVDYEGELHLSQFDLHKTYFRELNFTRSESGECLLRPPNLYILHFHFLSWNIFSPSSCVFTAETYRILSYPGKQQL